MPPIGPGTWINLYMTLPSHFIASLVEIAFCAIATMIKPTEEPIANAKIGSYGKLSRKFSNLVRKDMTKVEKGNVKKQLRKIGQRLAPLATS